MRVLVVGGTGPIGAAVVELLRGEHDVIAVGHSSGDDRVDISSSSSIRDLLGRVGPVDGLISCAGQGAFKPLADLTDEDFAFSLGHKLMGQINLARLGIPSVNDGGSITLTSGVLAREPSPGSAAISL